MNRILAVAFGAAVAATPALGRGDANPVATSSPDTCEGLAECPAEEDASLLQVRAHPDLSLMVADVADVAGPGCPSEGVWGILQFAAQQVFNSLIVQYVPFSANHTFDHQDVSYGNCSANVTGTAFMTANGSFAMSKLICNSATCARANWLGLCEEYNPMNMTVGMTAKDLTFEAYLNGTASWNENCLHGMGSAKVNNIKLSFTVANVEAEGTGALDLIVGPPPNISLPHVSGLSLSYSNISNVECTEEGQPFDACIGAVEYLNTPEFKQALMDAIDAALAQWGSSLDSLLASLGLGLNEVAARSVRRHRQ